MSRYNSLSPLTEPTDFNARIRFVRAKLCNPALTQTEMAKILDLSFRMMQEFEISKRAPRAETLALLVRHFEDHYPARRIDLRWLFLGEGKGSVDELTVVMQYGVVVDASAALVDLIGIKADNILGAKSSHFLALDSKVEIDTNVAEGATNDYPITLLTGKGKRIDLIAHPENITYRRKPARRLRFTYPEAAQSLKTNSAKTRQRA